MTKSGTFAYVLGITVLGLGSSCSSKSKSETGPSAANSGSASPATAEDGANEQAVPQVGPAPAATSPSPAPSSPASLAVAQSAVQYDAISTASVTNVQQRAQAMNAAGWAVYNNLVGSTPNDNILISPLSLEAAFALLYPGTKGTTAAQLAAVLQFDSDEATLASKMSGLLQKIAAAGNGVPTSSHFSYKLSNDVWLQNGLSLNPPYLDAIKQNYNASVDLVDFSNAATAVQEINTKVSNDTSGAIPNLLAPSSVNAQTALVLTNALYLLADWQQPFKASGTVPTNFSAGDGTSVSATMMNQTASFPFQATATYQATLLPYVGGNLAMLVVLPTVGTSLAAVEQALGPEGVNNLMTTGFNSTLLALSLPKFTFHWQKSLAAPLRALGMMDPFSKNADFTGVLAPIPDDPLFISDVVQETYIKVDELGTTAAAATAVTISTSAVAAQNPTPVNFVVNRPAFIAIVEMHTHAALFVGRLTKPVIGD